MLQEALPQNTNEIAAPAESLLDNLKTAQQAFYGLPFETGFNELCIEEGLTLDDVNKPEYWHAVAEFASQASAEKLEQGGDKKQIVLNELLAATPSFIYDNAKLNHLRGSARVPNEEFHAVKRNVSYFNGLIRYAAEQWPEMRASELSQSLLNIANISIEDPVIKRSASRYINDGIRGAQHETAFGQLLEATGRTFQEADIDEDLRGIDYVIDRPDGHGVDYVDVKASLSEIEHHAIKNHSGAAGPYARARDGHLVMYSLITDKELNDHFFVSDKLAKQRGEGLADILNQAAPASATM